MKKVVIFLLFFLMNIIICTSNIFATEPLILKDIKQKQLNNVSKAVNVMTDTIYKIDDDFYNDEEVNEQERIRSIIEAEPKYFLKVSKSTNIMTVYSKDSSGNYTIPKAEFVVSTGMSPGMTPVGRFTLGPKEEWHQWYYGGTYSPYTIPYANGLYIHGPIYNHRDFNSLIHSTAADVGQNVTSGCIKSTTEVAKYIFDNCVTGTIVEITN